MADARAGASPRGERRLGRLITAPSISPPTMSAFAARQKNAVRPGWPHEGWAIVAVADGRVQTAGDAQERWVGVRGMSGLAGHLAAGLAIRSELQIAGLARNNAAWLLGQDGSPVGEADIVIDAVRAPQAVELLTTSPQLAARAAEPILQPC